MKTRSLVAAATIGFMFLLVLGIKAEAVEIKVLSAFGMQSVLEDLAPKFERATGNKLALTFATGGATVKRVQGGEAYDVVITLRQAIETLMKDDKALAGNVTALASAGISVAIRKGAPKPDISSPDALGSATDAEAATALVNSLRTPEAAAVIKAKGMEPATR